MALRSPSVETAAFVVCANVWFNLGRGEGSLAKFAHDTILSKRHGLRQTDVIDRMKLSSDYFDSGGEMNPGGSEPFVQVPSVFTTGLSPEQFRALQQIYQSAYEKARQQNRNEASGDEYSFEI